mmetsp:Transcript_68195/g.220374  ORF Transcript_68195/g.220374 Transcript_68195/m.220374 type:complete len:250 (+) Transcript_68195:718-1467(+)
MSFSSLSTSDASAWRSVSRPFFSFLLAKSAFSFACSSFLQDALMSTSSSCVSFNCSTITSIISFTLWKESIFTAEARAESCARGPGAAVINPAAAAAAAARDTGTLGPLRRPPHSIIKSSVSKEASCAACCRARAARPRRSARTCTKDMVSASWSKLSSDVRMPTASVTAFSSARRVTFRCSQSWSRSLQVFLMLARNALSAASCSRVASSSSLASVRAFSLLELSCSKSSSFCCATAICFFFAWDISS